MFRQFAVFIENWGRIKSFSYMKKETRFLWKMQYMTNWWLRPTCLTCRNSKTERLLDDRHDNRWSPWPQPHVSFRLLHCPYYKHSFTEPTGKRLGLSVMWVIAEHLLREGHRPWNEDHVNYRCTQPGRDGITQREANVDLGSNASQMMKSGPRIIQIRAHGNAAAWL